MGRDRFYSGQQRRDDLRGHFERQGDESEHYSFEADFPMTWYVAGIDAGRTPFHNRKWDFRKFAQEVRRNWEIEEEPSRLDLIAEATRLNIEPKVLKRGFWFVKAGIWTPEYATDAHQGQEIEVFKLMVLASSAVDANLLDRLGIAGELRGEAMEIAGRSRGNLQPVTFIKVKEKGQERTGEQKDHFYVTDGAGMWASRHVRDDKRTI